MPRKHGKPSVLLVDDEPENLECLSLHFKQNGFYTLTANSAEPAIRIAKLQLPDAIVMDMSMPGRDGMYAVRKLKATPRTAHIPVLILTAMTTPGMEYRCLSQGADGYLVKTVHEWRAVPLQVRKLIERPEGPNGKPLRLGVLSVDMQAQNVLVSGDPVRLTPHEFRLLSCLIRRSPDIVPWKEIQTECWYCPEDRLRDKSTPVIDTTLSHLKSKLGSKASPYVQSHKGIGLQFQVA
ncbi:response regulator transcription factor [Elusimicrobiota bacterium]